MVLSQDAFRRMTAFQRSFWQKKRRHMDVVFFVRVGAFYELYDVRPSSAATSWPLYRFGVTTLTVAFTFSYTASAHRRPPRAYNECEHLHRHEHCELWEALIAQPIGGGRVLPNPLGS